ncbi:Arginine kinase [Aphelenchoides bicaudatus]|nr:Arginine kinase [Aphelenchoides bicaudatus]
MSIQAKAVAGLLGTSFAGYVGYKSYNYTREMWKLFNQEDETDAITLKRIEDAYKTLNAHPECNSLLKKHLTRDVIDKLKYKKTKLGATLYDVIRSGVYNLDAGIGVYAPDAQSYKTFSALFDPIIQEYHGFTPNDKQPPVDLGEGKTEELAPLDPSNKYIISTRIRCGRTLKGYPFNPLLTGDDYLIMQEKVKRALAAFQDKDLKGTYYPLDGMTKQVQNQLIKGITFCSRKATDIFNKRMLAVTGHLYGRGIYHNNDKTFLIWVNEEDHMRIISMEEGSNVGKILDRLNRGIKTIESQVPFARDERLGWLTFCPTNLGSTVRASVHIRLPKLSAKSDFKKVCEDLNLQVRGIHGEHSESEGGVYDISNKAPFGYDGVKKLIELEKAAA